MQFTLSRAHVQAIAGQLLRTCNAKNERTKLDGYIYFEVQERENPDAAGEKVLALTAATSNGAADQVAEVPTVALTAAKGDGFFVEGALFTEFLKTFSHDEIICKLTPNNDLLMGSVSKKSYMTLPTISAENYAPMHFAARGTAFQIDGKALSKALRLTAFSASTEVGKRPSITAVKLGVDGEALTSLSTDGSRISRVTTTIEDVGAKYEFLIPRASAEILGQLLAQVDVVTLEPGRNHLRVVWEGTTFTTALEMSGAAYPDVEPFFDRTLVSTANISRGELLSGLKITGLIAKDTYVRLDLDPAEGLMVSAKQRAGTTTEVTVVVQEADELADSIVTFKHLKSGVDIITSAFVTLEFREVVADTLAPVLKDNEGFEYLILPIEPSDEPEVGDASDEE